MAERYPVALHGVSLSVGSTDPWTTSRPQPQPAGDRPAADVRRSSIGGLAAVFPGQVIDPRNPSSSVANANTWSLVDVPGSDPMDTKDVPHGVVAEVSKCVDYVERNRERMRYPQFRAAGLCTSTGVVEAGCKTAIGTRCKRTGMHWTVAGVDAIIGLRCSKLSRRFEGFWERRAQRRAA